MINLKSFRNSVHDAIRNRIAPKYQVCDKCGVHFEPGTGYTNDDGTWCGEHGKPFANLDRKRRQVAHWAAMNWERLAGQMDKEYAERQGYADASSIQNHNQYP